MRKWSFAALMIVGAVFLGATVFRAQVAAAAPAILQVFVTNDASNPVPVAVKGTPSVAVTDERTPFEMRLNLSLGDGDFSDANGFTVPDAKRLVVEFISARVTLPLGQTPSIFVNALSGATGFALPLDPQGVRDASVGTFNEFGSALKTLDFEESGGFYDVLLERQPDDSAGGNVNGSGTGSVFISGYLIDE
jgi:hypothetical protein